MPSYPGMRAEHISSMIFDLDGTLVDSSSDIKESLSQAFALAGLIPPFISNEHIGPKLSELIDGLSPGISAGDKQSVMRHYRAIYDSLSIPKAKIIAGAMETLNYLKKRNILLFVATNKPASATIPLLAHLQIESYFCRILTPTTIPGHEMTKTSMVETILSSYAQSKATTAIVGDHPDDIAAGKRNGIKTIAFLGGYSSKEALMSHDPDHLIKDLSEITDLI